MRCAVCNGEAPSELMLDGACPECLERSVMPTQDDYISFRFTKKINIKRSRNNDTFRNDRAVPGIR